MSYKPVKDIKNMADLREQIDMLDRDIIAQLAFRQSHVDRAAELKPAEGMKARIPVRVNEVLDRVEAAAQEAGFEPALARHMWAQMIEAMIAREERVLGQKDEETSK